LHFSVIAGRFVQRDFRVNERIFERKSTKDFKTKILSIAFAGTLTAPNNLRILLSTHTANTIVTNHFAAITFLFQTKTLSHSLNTKAGFEVKIATRESTTWTHSVNTVE
jgi:hypothetical protein